jgi:hypothetical protein
MSWVQFPRLCNSLRYLTRQQKCVPLTLYQIFVEPFPTHPAHFIPFYGGAVGVYCICTQTQISVSKFHPLYSNNIICWLPTFFELIACCVVVAKLQNSDGCKNFESAGQMVSVGRWKIWYLSCNNENNILTKETCNIITYLVPATTIFLFFHATAWKMHINGHLV